MLCLAFKASSQCMHHFGQGIYSKESIISLYKFRQEQRTLHSRIFKNTHSFYNDWLSSRRTYCRKDLVFLEFLWKPSIRRHVTNSLAPQGLKECTLQLAHDSFSLLSTLRNESRIASSALKWILPHSLRPVSFSFLVELET